MRFKKLLFFFGAILSAALVLSGCIRNEYRFFRTEKSILNDSIQTLLKEDNPIFTIRKNDIIELNVYTSNGERIIDPDQEYLIATTGNSANALTRTEQYFVQKDGSVFLPMVGRIHLEGLNIRLADSLLSVKYNSYYKNSYVKTRIVNKRIIVIGPSGAKVIKIENEDVNLVEALALYGGFTNDMRTDRIRILRGNLSTNPEVLLINLSTIEGMRSGQHKLLPGDIIYIEPIKRVFRETMTDILPSISLVVSLLTLLVLINRQ